MVRKMTVVLEKAGAVYTAKCLEVDVVSQGKTIGQALDKITEAINLYLGSSKKKAKEIFIATVDV